MIAEFEQKAQQRKWFFLQGWLSLIGAMKWLALRMLAFKKEVQTVPCSHRDMLAWAAVGTALACENLMLAAQAWDWRLVLWRGSMADA